MPADPGAQGGPTRDMAFYERLIRRGIAEADARGSAIDHVTARRLSLWLLPHSQDDPDFMRSLVYFARTGGVPDSFRQGLRRRARSPVHPNRAQAAWLLQYTVARGRDTGRIGDNFGAACDQMDYADAALEDLQRERGNPEPAEPAERDWRDAIPLKPVALARRDEVTRAVTFILDAKVAEAAVQAITGEAMAREARIRQARQQAADLSQGSYGRRNREDIAARETAIADGLRAIERAYRQALEPGPATEFSYITHPRKTTAEYDLELE